MRVQRPWKEALPRWAKILLGGAACLVLLPVACALWVARGDPDIRIDQHRDYLAAIDRSAAPGAPNIVLVFADDLGYGDLSSYGSKAIQTPHLDALARDGVKLSPSRFSSGPATVNFSARYAPRLVSVASLAPTRGFMHSVFFPSGTPMGMLVNTFSFPRGIRGIPPDEVTVAEALQASGYATGMFGKWHLGDRSPHLPTDKGFDYFFGSYYSNDMKPYAIYRNSDVAIEAPTDQAKLTRALTSEVLGFIDRTSERPFFVYYASPFPHHPAHSSDHFAGKSSGGSYGDCVEELDWSVGEIQARLAERGLSENTLFVFTSDNGPWHEGSPGLHRGRKANSFDGGQVVPFIASWPGTIPAASEIDTPAMSIDLFPTFLEVAGVPLPEDRIVDGVDLSPLLRGKAHSALDRPLFFVSGGDFAGVRSPGNLKYLEGQRSDNSAYWVIKPGPFLFDLNYDPTESYDVSERFPGERAELAAAVREMNRARDENPRGWRMRQ